MIRHICVAGCHWFLHPQSVKDGFLWEKNKTYQNPRFYHHVPSMFAFWNLHKSPMFWPSPKNGALFGMYFCSFVRMRETTSKKSSRTLEGCSFWTSVQNCRMTSTMTGWWLTYPSEKYESQLGWLVPIYGKIKNVPNNQPERNCLILQRCL